jgi:hypothetical protein
LIKDKHIPSILLICFSFFIAILGQDYAFARNPAILPGGGSTQIGLDTGYHNDTPTRTKIDLSGIWQLSYDHELWHDVPIPSSIDFEGWTVLKRDIELDEQAVHSSVFKVVALGINYDCDILINDILIGKHSGGYTSFEFEIPEGVLHAGTENRLQIFVQNQMNIRSTIPPCTQVSGWKNYNGIIRDIYLLATPKFFINTVHVHAFLNEETTQGTIHVKTVLQSRDFFTAADSARKKGGSPVYVLTAELYNRFSEDLVARAVSQPIGLHADGESTVDLSIFVDTPKLWSPETPDLYQVKLNIAAVEGKQQTLVDQYIQNVGFTKIVLKKDAVLVNGVPTLIKGVVWHEDSPDHGVSLTHEQMEKDVIAIKSLGANAVRCAFHPPHPYFLSLCSRYGLFVLEELPVWNVPGDILADGQYLARAQDQVVEMVGRDEANPCILAWGIGDQFDSADQRAQAFVQAMTAAIKQIDGRPVYFGSIMMHNDVCVGDVDFAAVTLPRVEIKDFRILLTEWKKLHPAQPVLLLGYGKEVDQQNHNGYSDPMSQEAQARFFLQYYTAVKDAGIAGSFIDAYNDWKGSRPLLTISQPDPYIHPYGLVNEHREKRLAFEIVHALYTNEKISPLPIGGYHSSLPFVHIFAGFFVLLFVGYQYSYNRRFSEALQRSLFRLHNFFVDLRDLHTVSVMHTLSLALALSVSLAILFSSVLYHYRSDWLFDYILSFFIIYDPLKEYIIRIVWNPLLGIVSVTAFFFAVSCILAFFMKLIALVLRIRISWFDMYSMTVWGSGPLIFLSPLAMCLFKVLQTPSYVLPSFGIVIVFFVWTLIRLLKGISVLFDVRPIKAYSGGAALIILALGGIFLFYDSFYGLSSYIKFIAHLANNLG